MGNSSLQLLAVAADVDAHDPRQTQGESQNPTVEIGVAVSRRNAATVHDRNKSKWIGNWNVQITSTEGVTTLVYFCIDASEDAEVREIILRNSHNYFTDTRPHKFINPRRKHE